MMQSNEFWRRCSSCKATIDYKSKYYECSVSTCTRKRTGYVFCSVHCWERHLPGARHRDAAAIEKVAPTFEEWQRELSEEEAATTTSNTTPAMAEGQSAIEARRFIVREAQSVQSRQSAATVRPASAPKDILIVASKLKAYVRARSEMNTSDAVMEILSDKVRTLCDEAIERARTDGRKTVLERDFK